ncbi:hypothetical protein L810_7603 [Burkholderia sp. AU4i]|nr:hypothetical protein L810_7603 [Burkholderia sp. AU4i]MDW9227755.1 hypothetical protein [Burkholderia cepacia]MDW9242584.1 hypothetical protein [Burkholderia cepacia]QOH34276.1 hypothetical protein C7S14_4894 [Burkholderia cepacia]
MVRPNGIRHRHPPQVTLSDRPAGRTATITTSMRVLYWQG